MLSPKPYLVAISLARSVFPNLRQRVEPALHIAPIMFRWGVVRSALHSFFANMRVAADIHSSFMNAIASLNLSVRALRVVSNTLILPLSSETSFSCFSVRACSCCSNAADSRCSCTFSLLTILQLRVWILLSFSSRSASKSAILLFFSDMVLQRSAISVSLLFSSFLFPFGFLGAYLRGHIVGFGLCICYDTACFFFGSPKQFFRFFILAVSLVFLFGEIGNDSILIV